MYVNPNYVAKVESSISTVGATSTDGVAAAKVKSLATGVWLDRIAAIAGTSEALGLEGHLQAALAQQKAAGNKDMTITLVVYDLPDRDCAASASNGELSSANNGMTRYKTEYIDAIAKILAKDAYKSLRIVLVIEPDSLPNMVTNAGGSGAYIQKCVDAKNNAVYETGVKYALTKFAAIPNVYQYLDIAHSGWLGWDNNMSSAVSYYDSIISAVDSTRKIIRGFVTNVANYTPNYEPYLDHNSQAVWQDSFYEWNKAPDELTFVDKLRAAFVAKGYTTQGYMIDTGRNGWGKTSLRPSSWTGVVATSRIDTRAHRGNWCNPKNAGIGARPAANPDSTRSYLDAFFWVKGPGESDGTSDTTATTANDEGKLFDKMCNPTTSTNTDAMLGAPHAGHWFHDQFIMLVQNAYPKF